MRRIGKAFEYSNQYISLRFNQFERLRHFSHVLPLPATLRFKRHLAYLDNLVYGLIEQRQATRNGEVDLLSLMLDAELDDESESPHRRMNAQQVRDETITMFAVGHETVTVALTWTWYLLSLHPTLQSQFHDELDEVLGVRTPTVDDLPKLVKTEQIIKESMRLYPPIWRTGRVVLEQFDLGGYKMPRGSLLCVAPIITHRDSRWFEEPAEFQPSRWTSCFESNLRKFAYFPFGGGNRLCIGENFAWMEMKLIMATIGQCWKVRPSSTRDRDFTPLVSLRPKNGMPLFLERR